MNRVCTFLRWRTSTGKAAVQFLIVCTLQFALTGCASYYQTHAEFNSEFEQGELERALQTLGRHEEESGGKTRLIYFLNKGLLLSILGKYEESNAILEKAFLFGEDYRVNYVAEAATYFTNPNVSVYRGEDHEHLMLLYYKAINYLKMKQPQEALVECRRLNIRLNQLADRYSSAEKLKQDAFIHNLMGIIYQATGDFNNAFIAYRNAMNVYHDVYLPRFEVDVPLQLKKDLLTAAWRSGFTDEFERYRDQFGMENYAVPESQAELIFFWHNGLAPIKSEWSINFVIDKGSGNTMLFNESTMGLSFPFEVTDDNDRASLERLRIFRVAFPRYIERPVHFQSASIQHRDSAYTLELAEDVNKIAFNSLQQRMTEELAKGLLRAALKKATEETLRKKDDRLGAVLGLMNAITEKADTRSWQTLPHGISYCRVPLEAGVNQVDFTLTSTSQAHYKFTFTARKGETLFHTFSSLETNVPNRYY